jgi:hypothetical protein
MGIDYSGKLLVGGTYDDICHLIPDDDEDIDVSEFIEQFGLVYASPWYDAGIEDCVFGFNFPDTPFTEGWHLAFEEAAAKWKELTGKDAKLMGVQDIW